jgi:hypothetical protein
MYMKKLVFLPNFRPETFLLLTARRDGTCLRSFPDPRTCNVETRRYTTEQIMEMLSHSNAITISANNRVRHDWSRHWCAEVSKLNAEYGLPGPPSLDDAWPAVAAESTDHARTKVALGSLCQQLEEKIHILIEQFRVKSHDFFHEKDLHATFFALCRDAFGNAKPKGSENSLRLFRHEYDTVWRYRRANGYNDRSETVGTSACLDFALLDAAFVSTQDHHTVMNKNERNRQQLRCSYRNTIDDRSPAVLIGIEFKMAIARSASRVQGGGVRALAEGMLADCRKLAMERIPCAYVLGFSHGPRPSENEAAQIAAACEREYLCHYSAGRIRVLVATPEFRTGCAAGSSCQPFTGVFE